MLRSISASSSASLSSFGPAANLGKLQRHFTPIIPIRPFTPPIPIISATHICRSGFPSSDEVSGSHWDFVDDDKIGEDNGDSPWEGAILYTRNAAVSHLEYSTTLERLGLDKVSTEFSKNRASEMGLRIIKLKNDSPSGTPVLISVDVTRRKQKLRLDGIIRTVLALNCNRCGEPTAQIIYSEFSLLLHEEPIQEPETINMVSLSGDPKLQSLEETDDESIDPDDQLYFPVHEKTIDISKNIRDLIHVEINMSAQCDPNCRGLCLKCGTNLNFSVCACKNKVAEEKGHGPLGELRKRMQHI